MLRPTFPTIRNRFSGANSSAFAGCACAGIEPPGADGKRVWAACVVLLLLSRWLPLQCLECRFRRAEASGTASLSSFPLYFPILDINGFYAGDELLPFALAITMIVI